MDRNRAKTKLKEMKTQSKMNLNSRKLQHIAINRENVTLKCKKNQPAYTSKMLSVYQTNIWRSIHICIMSDPQILSDLITTKANNNQSKCIFFIIPAVLQGFYNDFSKQKPK